MFHFAFRLVALRHPAPRSNDIPLALQTRVHLANNPFNFRAWLA